MPPDSVLVLPAPRWINRQFETLAAWDIFNFTTTWKGIMGSNFDANVWIKNLMDKKYVTHRTNQMLGAGYANAWFGNPRTFGLNVKYNF
jgi:iron complex outermembrane receptor protein